jgi:hypothetical protein
MLTVAGRGNPDFEPEEGVESQALAAAKQMRLDNFLAGHTSEDNAAYEIIVAKERQKQRAKHAWLYRQEEKSIKPMPITGMHHLVANFRQKKASIESMCCSIRLST